MLNLSTLEDEFQQVLKSAKIDCGGIYRVIKQGDSFNCKSLDSPNSNQTIIVKIENAGRITWQEVKEAEPLAMNTLSPVSNPRPSPTTSATDQSASSPNPVVSATNHPSPVVSATTSATANTSPTSPSSGAKSSPSKNESDWEELGD